mgnify:FL=1
MIVAAIICEYNPFHNGHLRQLEMVRQRLGDDATIVGIMSGNYVQRGELASAPKYRRAEVAIRCGCDLVLELPHPWSCSSAEFFARAGVRIADALGVVDVLCFGSESLPESAFPGTAAGTLDYSPEEEAAVVRVREYLCRMRALKLPALPQRDGSSKLRAAETIYKEKYGEVAFFPTRPNDILAAEYIDALDSIGSKILPLPMPRIKGLSATASRAAWERGDFELLSQLVPSQSLELCRRQGAPVSSENLGIALPMHFLLSDPAQLARCCDADGGLAERLCKAAKRSAGPSELYANTAAKHLTAAKIRRAALFCLFGVTYDEVSAPPPYTLLLAANPRGTKLLRAIKKRSRIPVVTKPADYRLLPEEAARAFERSLRADEVYMLATGERENPIKMSPVILQGNI